MALDTEDNEDLKTLNIVFACISSGLSVLGALSILLSAFFFRDIHKKVLSLRLIVNMAFCDVGACLSIIIGIIGRSLTDDGTFCTLQASGIQFFNVAAFFWTTCFAHSLYYHSYGGGIKSNNTGSGYGRLHFGGADEAPINQGSNSQLFTSPKMRGASTWKQFERAYHIVSWGVSAILVIFLLATKKFGDAGNWCWIQDDDGAYRFALFYGPLWVLMSINIMIYINVIFRKGRTSVLVRKVTLYILVFIIVWTPGTFYRLDQFLTGDAPTWLALLHTAISPLQGFLNCFIYGWSMPQLRDRYKDVLFNRNKGKLYEREPFLQGHATTMHPVFNEEQEKDIKSRASIIQMTPTGVAVTENNARMSAVINTSMEDEDDDVLIFNPQPDNIPMNDSYMDTDT